MTNRSEIEFDLDLGDIALGAATATGIALTAPISVSVGLATAAVFTMAYAIDDSVDGAEAKVTVDHALSRLIPYLQTINQSLIDGFAGRDIELEELYRKLQFAGRASHKAGGALPEQVFEDVVTGRDAEGWEEIQQTFNELRFSDEIDAFKQALAQFGEASEAVQLRQQQLDSDQPTTPALTPEEAVAAFAPSADMQGRIEAFEASLSRLVDPLLPDLEERIRSLSDVLEDCAARACCGDGSSLVGVMLSL